MSEPTAHQPMPQPTDSKVQLVQDSQSTTLVVPPAGYHGMVRAMGCFAVAWNVGMLVFTFIFLFAVDFADGAGFGKMLVAIGLVPFWLIGIAILLGSYQAARRRAVFIVTKSDGIVFSQVGPLRKAERQWPAASITRIHMDASGTTINEKPVMELKIHSTGAGPDGKLLEKVDGLLSGRDEEELKWIASTLRDALTGLKS